MQGLLLLFVSPQLVEEEGAVNAALHSVLVGMGIGRNSLVIPGSKASGVKCVTSYIQKPAFLKGRMVNEG